MDVPGFCNLAVGKAINGHPRYHNPIARGADAHQFAFVGATSHPARCYPVSLSYHILDLNVDVGEGRAVHASELLQAFAAVLLSPMALNSRVHSAKGRLFIHMGFLVTILSVIRPLLGETPSISLLAYPVPR